MHSQPCDVSLTPPPLPPPQDLDTKVSDLYRDLKEIDDELRNLVIELELGGDLEDVEDVPYVNIPLH